MSAFLTEQYPRGAEAMSVDDKNIAMTVMAEFVAQVIANEEEAALQRFVSLLVKKRVDARKQAQAGGLQ
ncbi:hypothetical protein [Methylobacterium soli]|uniref:Uncharacterized protein n=1 Tax=Methylobacterium soli TaxID=553447 RepID=A0A6L3SUI4_9HYPH|nr:hypothetical protein [Methylobacterium soli]KAB1075421.1 hypothetical protein F6X53_24975 [Methylobacterium soli]